MREFPVKKLKPLPASLIARGSGCAIKIPLEPFNLDGKTIETSIQLEDVSISAANLRDLAGHTFEFPRNPEPGYIDGSIYIVHAHHPVDVTSIRFCDMRGDYIEAEFEMTFVFEFEGLDDYRDAVTTLLVRFAL